MEPVIKEIYDSILNGQQKVSSAKVQEALDQGINPVAILNDGMVAAMAEVGRLFEEGEYFVPEMLIAARAMQSGLAVLKPRLAAADVKSSGKVIAGTVKGDLHDIGKNLVCMMLEGAGFKVVDAGINVEPDKMVQLAKENNANLIGASALLTTTMTNMKSVVEAVKAAGMTGKVKVMIGGAPVTQAFADEIGADGYAPDAASAADLAKKLSGVK